VHGLCARGAKINNGQAAVAKSGGIAIIDPVCFTIGSAMGQHTGHFL
jgi:hypothetical protein